MKEPAERSDSAETNTSRMTGVRNEAERATEFRLRFHLRTACYGGQVASVDKEALLLMQSFPKAAEPRAIRDLAKEGGEVATRGESQYALVTFLSKPC
jgi:hypothetical protein